MAPIQKLDLSPLLHPDPIWGQLASFQENDQDLKISDPRQHLWEGEDTRAQLLILSQGCWYLKSHS